MKKILRYLFKRSARILAGLIFTGVALANVTGYLPSEFVRRLDYLIYDARLRAEASKPVLDDRIVIVDLDERSLQEVGRWPWSRDVIAKLITELTDKLGAAVVSFDVVFAEPEISDASRALAFLEQESPDLAPKLESLKPKVEKAFDRDAQLAGVLAQRPVLLGYYLNNNPNAISGALPPALFTRKQLGGLALQTTQWKGYGANLFELQKVSEGGFFNPIVDEDGTVRAIPLVAEFDGKFYQSFSLGTIRAALGNPQVIPVFPADVPDSYGALEVIALRSAEVELDIPVERGMISLVNYRGRGGPDGGGFRYIPAADVLAGKLTPEDVAGRIVLVGTTAPGLLDLRSTPVNPAFPGVEVHANVLSSILDGKFKMRPEFATGVTFVSVAMVGVVLSLLMPLLSATWSLMVAVFVVVGSIAVNTWAYTAQDMVIPVAVVLILALTIFMFDVAYGYLAESRTKRQMVNLFGEYVAPELVTEMADNPTGYSMEGESRNLTVLFSDVRGFTTISESLEPNQLREYINEYLTCMSEIIRGERGTLDKYIGDAIMAFWGAPIPDEQHAEFAVRAGMAMLEEVPNLNARLKARGWPPLAIGVGVNTGQMRVGDMGSKIRKAYTVMGDAVNLGSRLEGITKTYGVGLIVGEVTRAEVPTFTFKELDMVRVKGKDEPVAIYQPLGATAELPQEKKDCLAIWEEFIVQFRGQKWDEAIASIEKLEAAEGEQVLYELYRDRIAVFREEPPPENWDGVTKFETK